MKTTGTLSGEMPHVGREESENDLESGINSRLFLYFSFQTPSGIYKIKREIGAPSVL